MKFLIAFQKFSWKAIEVNIGHKVKLLPTDNGEYNAFQNYLKAHGIIHQTYSPQQNGREDRLNRSLVERGLWG